MQGDLVITIRTFKKRLSQLEEITFDLIGFIADIRIYFVKIILRMREPGDRPGPQYCPDLNLISEL